MTSEQLTEEIKSVRQRLGEIEAQRDRLDNGATAEKATLDQEEHELRARLIRLQDASLKDWDTIELPGVPSYLAGRVSA